MTYEMPDPSYAAESMPPNLEEALVQAEAGDTEVGRKLYDFAGHIETGEVHSGGFTIQGTDEWIPDTVTKTYKVNMQTEKGVVSYALATGVAERLLAFKEEKDQAAIAQGEEPSQEADTRELHAQSEGPEGSSPETLRRPRGGRGAGSRQTRNARREEERQQGTVEPEIPTHELPATDQETDGQTERQALLGRLALALEELRMVKMGEDIGILNQTHPHEKRQYEQQTDQLLDTMIDYSDKQDLNVAQQDILLDKVVKGIDAGEVQRLKNEYVGARAEYFRMTQAKITGDKHVTRKQIDQLRGKVEEAFWALHPAEAKMPKSRWSKEFKENEFDVFNKEIEGLEAGQEYYRKQRGLRGKLGDAYRAVTSVRSKQRPESTNTLALVLPEETPRSAVKTYLRANGYDSSEESVERVLAKITVKRKKEPSSRLGKSEAVPLTKLGSLPRGFRFTIPPDVLRELHKSENDDEA